MSDLLDLPRIEVQGLPVVAPVTSIQPLDLEKLDLSALAQAQAQLRAEQQRVARITAMIQEIRAAATGHADQDAAALLEARTAVAALNVGAEVYQEFAVVAQAEKAATLAVLDKLHGEAATRETAAEEAKRAAEVAKAVATLAALPAYKAITGFTEGQEGRQVLKADGASPDATDRATPVNASPRVGAMGAGQAADAAPAADHGSLIVQAEPGDQSAITEAVAEPDPQAAFLALVMSAFDCKFPSHPKPSQEWWARVRAAGQQLQGAAA